MMKDRIFQFKKQILFCAILASILYKSVSEEALSVHQTMYVKDILSLSKSAAMRSYMNINESPCYDFYDFACGNWMKINPASEIQGKTQTIALDSLRSAFERKLINLLSVRANSADTITDKKMKYFFKSCMDGKTNKTQLLQLLSKYGSMPALVGDAWSDQNFDWLEVLSTIKRHYGLQLLIGLDVGSDLKEGTINRIFIGQPALKLLSKSLYLEKSGLKYRLAYRAEVAWHLQDFLSIPPDAALQIAEEIVGFEILLSNGLLPDKTNLTNDILIVETTVDELQTKYSPTLDFKKFFNLTLGFVPSGPIYVFVESYLENLKYVLETTNQRLLANYMFYLFLKEFFLQREDAIKQSSICLHKVRQHFAESLENMAYRRLNIAASEDDLKTIWIELRKAFKTKLYSKTLHWMTPEVREYAESKLNQISIKINSYENQNFSAHFSDLVIKDNDFLENLKQIFMLNTKYIYGKINKPVTTPENTDYLFSIPFTTHAENTISIPVILLQPYLIWAANYPSAMKFGTLGFLIARELIHSFDNKGRLYNKRGEMENWWDEPTTNAFMVDRECFIEQYPARFYSNIQFSIIDAESENIADNGGLKLAFNAFIDWKNHMKLKNDNFNEKLPNMNYTDEQLFFLSFAQLWCNDIYPSIDSFHATRDHHMPGKFRVNGALSNSEEFSNTYNCQADSVMSPSVFCELF